MAPKKAAKDAEPPPQEEQEDENQEEAPPPDPDLDTELSTGLQLPLRPADITHIWMLREDYAKMGEMVVQLTCLDEAFPGKEQRQLVRDFHLLNILHCKSLQLDHRQTSVFVAIMGNVLNLMRSQQTMERSSPEQCCSIEGAFKEFQRLLVTHCQGAAPASLSIFRVSEAKMLTDFATTTLFKHFKLYQYCINLPREVQLLRFSMALDRPQGPPDLRHGKLKEPSQRKKRGSKEIPAARGLSEDAGVATADGDQGDTGDSAEDQEVRRLVEARLAESRAMLDEKLQQRQDKLNKRLEDKREGAGKKK